MATLAELLSAHHGKHVLPALRRTVLLSPGFVLNIHYRTLFSWCMLVSLGYVQLLLFRVAANQSSMGLKKLHCRLTLTFHHQ